LKISIKNGGSNMKKRTNFVYRHLQAVCVLLIIIEIGFFIYALYWIGKNGGRQEILKSLVDAQIGSRYIVKIDGVITAVYFKIAPSIDEKIINAKPGDKFGVYIFHKKEIATIINNDTNQEFITIQFPSDDLKMAINGCWIDVPGELLQMKKHKIRKQAELFSMNINTTAGKCADQLVDLYDDEKELKKKFDKQETKMAEAMRELGKNKISHKGHIIELQHIDSKEKIKIKGFKTKKDNHTIGQESQPAISLN
jgi:hypothetical protein